MVVGSEEMENADNGCFMPIISSEKDSEIFFSKLSGTELLIAYLNNKGYTPSNKIFYYKSKAPKTKKIFIVKNSLLDSGLDKSYLKDSRYPKNFSYAFYLFFTTNDNNELSIHIKKEGLTPLNNSINKPYL